MTFDKQSNARRTRFEPKSNGTYALVKRYERVYGDPPEDSHIPRSLKIIRSDTDWSDTYDFLLAFRSNRFQDTARCEFFLYPVYLTPNFVTPDGLKNNNYGATRPIKKFNIIFSLLDTVGLLECDRQTDGRTDEQKPADGWYRASHAIAR